MPVAGPDCICEIRHDIRQTNGNTVMGTTYLVVSNSGLESHTVSLPLQDALLLTPGSTSTFRLGLQAERVLLSASSVTVAVRNDTVRARLQTSAHYHGGRYFLHG